MNSFKKYKRILFIFTLLFFTYYIIFPHPTINLMKVESNKQEVEELQEREIHLEKTCTKLGIKASKPFDDRLYHNKPIRLLYCKVPKCGSTYWMRLFEALQYRHNKFDPFNIPRTKVHQIQLEDKVKEIFNFNDSTRVIVTRNPYSRLYSAYVDKIYLPEQWHTMGRAISYYHRPNATLYSNICGNDVTFVEFLKMIVHRNRVPLDWRNPHWLPIEQLCSPCTFKYNFIIRQETFSRDRDYLVRKVGIKEQSILTYNNISHWDFALKSIKDMCYSVHMYFQKGRVSSCYKMEVFLQKLFVSFQIQGYIREDARFDLKRFGDLKETNIKSIAEVFQNIYREHPVLTQHDWEGQRKTFRKKAYKLVDTEILEGIKKCYDLDFKIFNYDPEPEEIFGNRNKSLNN